jgi:hypothetical protein
VKPYVIAAVALAAIAVVLGLDPHLLQDVRGWTGSVTNPNGTSYDDYQAYSGILPALAIVSLLGAAVQALRHHNCHVKGCWRMGHPVEGTPYVACHVHHPAHEGKGRGVSENMIHQAHAARRR